MAISCIRADLMKEYFIGIHEEGLNKKLQSKLGEYAEITINTVSNEDGGDIELSLGIYNLREELVNFSGAVAQRINNDKDYEYNDVTAEEVEKTINQLLDIYNVNMDIDWEEKAKMIHLFFKDSLYDNMDIYNEMQRYYYIILDELYNSISDFLNDTINQTIKEFNEAWVLEYSAYEEDTLEN